MSVFDPDTDLTQDMAFRLMHNSLVRLFWRPTLLHQALVWLCDHGYHIVELDADAWNTEQDMHHAFASALNFPDYYGNNLNALNDCLRDVETYDYGTSRDATGLVLVLGGYDTFTSHCPRAAQIVLDIIADRARTAMLTGHRICCLVQSNDPNIRLEPVAAMPVLWNDAEWLDNRRRPDTTDTATTT
jgi:hypothetical protein